MTPAGIFLAGVIVGAQLALLVVGDTAARVAIGAVVVVELALVGAAWWRRRVARRLHAGRVMR